MIAGWFSNALPGFRELRPTIASGILWAFVLLVVGSETLANADTTEGVVGDLHEIAVTTHPIAVAVVAGVLIFALGAVALTAVEWAARRVGTATDTLTRTSAWIQHAERTYEDLVAEVDSKRAELSSIADSPTEGRPSKMEANLRRSLDRNEERLARVQFVPGFGPDGWLPWALQRLWPYRIRRTSRSIEALGAVPPQPGSGLERRIVIEAALNEAERILIEAGDLTPVGGVGELMWMRSGHGLDEEIARLGEEVRTSPAELLRAYSPEAYLQYDKEIVEARLRIAISAPLTALGLALAPVTNWALLLTVLGLGQFVASSFQLSRGTKTGSAERSGDF